MNTFFKLRTICISLIFFFFLFDCCAQMRQLHLETTQPDNTIYKLSFYSPSEGYVAFRDWIGYTTDSGRTFTQKNITSANVNYNGYSVNLTFGFGISGVKAFNQNIIIVYGDYGFVPAILYSNNGGNSFTLIYHSQYSFVPNGGITDMVFPQNGNIGYAIDVDQVLKTTNQGLTWSVIRTDPNSCFDRLDAIDDNNIFVISDYNSDDIIADNNSSFSNNKVLKTSNAGSNWQTVNIPSGDIRGISFITANKGWANVDAGLFYTDNAGSTWVQKNNSAVTPFASSGKIKFINDNTGYSLNGGFTVFKTTDSGKVWEPLPRDNNYSYLGYGYNDLQYLSSTSLWAGGDRGFLESSTNSGGTPIPKAVFKIDDTNVATSGIVNLVNYSNTNYQYRWYKNDTLISTAYNANYTHDLYKLIDTIKLIVSNNITMDTAVNYINFPLPIFIISATPLSGISGTTIAISGNNFYSVTGVFFGGVPAASFSIISPTQINAVIGSGASGNISISNSIRRDSLPGFIYTGTFITSISPISGLLGNTINITGKHFTGATAVNFGQTPSSSFLVINDTLIKAVVGPGTSGNVSVSTSNGYATFPGFTYTGPSSISSFAPTSAGPQSTITITGINFIGATAVSFGGTPALSFTVVSATTIIATVGNGLSGNISVTTPSNIATLGGFYFTTVPAITSFIPTSGEQGAIVKLNGKNFSPIPSKNIVYFGAVSASIVAASDTQLIVIVPRGATFSPISVTCNNLTAVTTKPFILTFPGGGSTISQNLFSQKTDFASANNPEGLFYDFDGDGRADMIKIDRYAYNFSISKNITSNDTVSFATPLEFVTGNAIFTPYVFIRVADLDGDGKLDIILRLLGENYGEIAIYTYKNISNNGIIAFDARQLHISIPAGQTISGLETISVADIDNDGKQDLLVWHGNVSPERFYYYKNTSTNGVISFASATLLFQAESADVMSSLSINDIDNDGKLDLLLTQNSTQGKIIVLRNTTINNAVSFAAGISFFTNEWGITNSQLNDLDGDGKPDLIIPNYIFNKMTIVRNLSTLGTISFAAKTNYTINGKPSNLSCGDLDGDGKPDIAVSVSLLTNQPEIISIFKNISSTGSITLAPVANFTVGNNPGFVSIGDLNGDGKPELAYGNGIPNGISILSNKINEYYTITNGNWNNPAIWQGGSIPPVSAIVNIKNSVIVTANASCYSLKIVQPGSVTVNTGINFTVTH